MTPEEVTAAARDWIGVPWQHQGRGRRGIDCIGLIQRVGDVFSLQYEDKTGYAREPTGTEFLHHLRRYLTHVEGNAIMPGAVGVFAQSKFPCHVGFFSMKNNVLHLIHANAAAHKVVEEPYQAAKSRLTLVEVLAFPGLEV